MLIPILEFVAVLSAALFAGAALYINVVEHPARMGLDTRMAAMQWAPSYKRATWLQAPLAIVSLLCGVAVWLLGGGVGWLVAASLVGAVVPVSYTHLRAHETVLDLVCRLLLDKKHTTPLSASLCSVSH